MLELHENDGVGRAWFEHLRRFLLRLSGDLPCQREWDTHPCGRVTVLLDGILLAVPGLLRLERVEANQTEREDLVLGNEIVPDLLLVQVPGQRQDTNRYRVPVDDLHDLPDDLCRRQALCRELLAPSFHVQRLTEDARADFLRLVQLRGCPLRDLDISRARVHQRNRRETVFLFELM